MTRGLVLSVVLGVVVPAMAGKGPSMPCADGRFLIAGAGLMRTAGTDDMIVIRKTRLAVKSGCGPAEIHTRADAGGVELRARWPRCRAARSTVRLRARFDASCEVLSGEIVAARGRRRVAFAARREQAVLTPTTTTTTTTVGGVTTTSTTLPAATGTFQSIVNNVFRRRGCAVSTCHGEAASGGLRLDPEHAYDELVGVPATSPGAGGALRVDPGRTGTSFLSRKLHGTLDPDEGARMPLGGAELPVLERDLVDIWIGSGAPEEGEVPGAPHITGEPYRPADPLPPPPAPGVQLVLDGPMLGPGEEIEGCMWVRVPNTQDILIRGVELSANPGTHHVAIWRYDRTGVPPNLNQWRPGDTACLASGASVGSPLGGTAVALTTTTSWGADVASVFPGNTYVGLNGHYYNEFDVPIQIKFWVNYLPFEGTPKHILQGITDLGSTFAINVPVGAQKIQSGRFTNTTGKSMFILWAGGHMHKRGLRFTGFFSNGTRMFEDSDWEHPIGRIFDPPFELRSGESIPYECLHDNGVTRPQRHCGDSPYDTCSPAGAPVAVRFGISAEDEMCILVGNYYSD